MMTSLMLIITTLLLLAIKHNIERVLMFKYSTLCPDAKRTLRKFAKPCRENKLYSKVKSLCLKLLAWAWNGNNPN